MIVCSCNVVSHCEIERIVEELFHEDPNVVLTPGKVYKAVGHRPKCATCLLHIGKLMHAHRELLQEQSERRCGEQKKNNEVEPREQRKTRTKRRQGRRTTRIMIHSSV